MNYYGAKALARSFRTVRNNTLIIAEEIPEDQYNFQLTPDTRTVSQLLSHIALTFNFQYYIHAEEVLTTLEGLDFPSLMQRLRAEQEKPRSKDEIIALLKSGADKWAQWVDELSEEFLAERVNMPPGAEPADKSRFEMILSVKEHEMHHRGQMMLIQRLLGIVPHLTRQMQERMAQLKGKK
ncbi:MAG: DinB family protein [Acidobacteriota bacterium]|nr:DinB family protein [Acidobacteriota bacterium]